MKISQTLISLFLLTSFIFPGRSLALAVPLIVPNVTSSLADGSYIAGQLIPVEVTFTDIVNVTGIPLLTLSTESPATTAIAYTSGSGTSTLIFNYTVAEGNNSADLDYATNHSLSLNGGTIKDAAGKNVSLRLANPGSQGSLGANKNIIIDTLAPSVTINQAAGQADPTSIPPINFTVVFTEEIADFSSGDVSLLGTAGAATAIVTGSGTTYNVAVSGMTNNGTIIAEIPAGVAHDAAGNPNVAGTSSDNIVTFNPTALNISWASPVRDGQVFRVTDQILQLEVAASSDVGISMVVFKRWDYVNKVRIEIGRVVTSPYILLFDTRVLLPGDNEIDAFAYDAMNNFSYAYIFLHHYHRYFIPLVYR
jgi:hypothetical protein